MAKEAEVHCGRLSVSWDALGSDVTALSEHGLGMFIRSTRPDQTENSPMVTRIQRLRTAFKAGYTMRLFETLLWSRMFKATHERERIYSLLGFVKESERLKLNCSTSTGELFAGVIENEVKLTRSLEILALLRGSRIDCDRRRPSWAGIWSKPHISFSEINPSSTKAVSLAGAFGFSPGCESLTVWGAIVGQVAEVAPAPRILVMDDTRGYRGAAAELCQRLVDWSISVELLSQSPRRKSQEMVDLEPIQAPFATVIDLPITTRVFCRCDDGSLGMVLDRSLPGDTVYVFFSAKAPLVIRNQGGERYQFIGDCYIDGLMKDEIMEWPDLAERAEDIILR